MPFTIRRGINISHWLSQSNKRGDERRNYFLREHAERMAEVGFDHLRIPVDEEQLWTEDGDPIEEAFDLLGAALDWCESYGLRAVVDLHILRSHHFNAAERSLFSDPSALERFLMCWEDLSRHMATRSVESVAYELLNESVADDPNDWNRIAAAGIGAIRAQEPERIVVLGSNRWNSPSTFDVLKVPDDERLILTFHFYEPFYLTHYRASWTPNADYTGPVHYPGKGIRRDDLTWASEAVRERIAKIKNFACRASMSRLIEKPLSVARKTGLPLYCGEWGCILLAPRPDRLRWYADVRRIFEDHDTAWCAWDRRGGFGIENESGEVDSELLSIMLD